MSSKQNREVTEGTLYQGEDERIAYTLDVSNVGDSPTAQSVSVYQVDGLTFTDVESTVMPTNTPTVSGNIITLSLLRDLTNGKTYQVEVKFTITGNIFEHYFRVVGQK